jgi:hypothetical protein
MMSRELRNQHGVGKLDRKGFVQFESKCATSAAMRG